MTSKHGRTAAGATASHLRRLRLGQRATGIALVILLIGGFSGCGAPFPGVPAAHRAGAAPSARAASQQPFARLCGQAGWPEARVADGAYIVQNDEWNSSAPECITTNGQAQFTVANSSIDQTATDDPGGYPSIFTGCSAGVCTVGTEMPIRVGDLRPGTITSSWTTTQPPGGTYDVAYDIWFNRAPTASGAPDGGELMIWLAHRGGSQASPAGAAVAHVTIGRYAYTVWLWPHNRGSDPGRDRITYVMDRTARSVRDLDVSAIAADAARRGYLIAAYYLLNVQAGFEIWHGGSGLETTSFAVNVRG